MARLTSWDKLNQIKFQLFVSKTIQSEMEKISAALELDKEEWVTSKGIYMVVVDGKKVAKVMLR